MLLQTFRANLNFEQRQSSKQDILVGFLVEQQIFQRSDHFFISFIFFIKEIKFLFLKNFTFFLDFITKKIVNLQFFSYLNDTFFSCLLLFNYIIFTSLYILLITNKMNNKILNEISGQNFIFNETTFQTIQKIQSQNQNIPNSEFFISLNQESKENDQYKLNIKVTKIYNCRICLQECSNIQYCKCVQMLCHLDCLKKYLQTKLQKKLVKEKCEICLYEYNATYDQSKTIYLNDFSKTVKQKPYRCTVYMLILFLAFVFYGFMLYELIGKSPQENTEIIIIIIMIGLFVIFFCFFLSWINDFLLKKMITIGSIEPYVSKSIKNQTSASIKKIYPSNKITVQQI